eukprot:gene12150-16268_t
MGQRYSTEHKIKHASVNAGNILNLSKLEEFSNAESDAWQHLQNTLIQMKNQETKKSWIAFEDCAMPMSSIRKLSDILKRRDCSFIKLVLDGNLNNSVSTEILDEKDTEHFQRMIVEAGIKSLSMNNCKLIKQIHFEEIVKDSTNNLISLSLGSTNFDDERLILLCTAMMDNKSSAKLQKLVLDNNNLTYKAARCLSTLLQQNYCILQTLSVRFNKSIDEDGLKYFSQALATNTSLILLDLTTGREDLSTEKLEVLTVQFGDTIFKNYNLKLEMFSCDGVNLGKYYFNMKMPPELGLGDATCAIAETEHAVNSINNKVLKRLKKIRFEPGQFLRTKVILLGDPKAGKTHLVQRLSGKIPTGRSTVGAEVTENITLSGRHNFQFWDNGGQNEYLPSHPIFFDENSIYLIVWDATKYELADGVTQQLLKHKLSDFYQLVRLYAPEANVIFIATRCDDQLRKYKKEQFGIIKGIVSSITDSDPDSVAFFHVGSEDRHIWKKGSYDYDKLETHLLKVADDIEDKISKKSYPGNFSLLLSKHFRISQADISQADTLPMGIKSIEFIRMAKDSYGMDEVDARKAISLLNRWGYIKKITQFGPDTDYIVTNMILLRKYCSCIADSKFGIIHHVRTKNDLSLDEDKGDFGEFFHKHFVDPIRDRELDEKYYRCIEVLRACNIIYSVQNSVGASILSNPSELLYRYTPKLASITENKSGNGILFQVEELEDKISKLEKDYNMKVSPTLLQCHIQFAENIYLPEDFIHIVHAKLKGYVIHGYAWRDSFVICSNSSYAGLIVTKDDRDKNKSTLTVISEEKNVEARTLIFIAILDLLVSKMRNVLRDGKINLYVTIPGRVSYFLKINDIDPKLSLYLVDFVTLFSPCIDPEELNNHSPFRRPLYLQKLHDKNYIPLVDCVKNMEDLSTVLHAEERSINIMFDRLLRRSAYLIRGNNTFGPLWIGITGKEDDKPFTGIIGVSPSAKLGGNWRLVDKSIIFGEFIPSSFPEGPLLLNLVISRLNLNRREIPSKYNPSDFTFFPIKILNSIKEFAIAKDEEKNGISLDRQGKTIHRIETMIDDFTDLKLDCPSYFVVEPDLSRFNLDPNKPLHSLKQLITKAHDVFQNPIELFGEKMYIIPVCALSLEQSNIKYEIYKPLDSMRKMANVLWAANVAITTALIAGRIVTGLPIPIVPVVTPTISEYLEYFQLITNCLSNYLESTVDAPSSNEARPLRYSDWITINTIIHEKDQGLNRLRQLMKPEKNRAGKIEWIKLEYLEDWKQLSTPEEIDRFQYLQKRRSQALKYSEVQNVTQELGLSLDNSELFHEGIFPLAIQFEITSRFSLKKVCDSYVKIAAGNFSELLSILKYIDNLWLLCPCCFSRLNFNWPAPAQDWSDPKSESMKFFVYSLPLMVSFIRVASTVGKLNVFDEIHNAKDNEISLKVTQKLNEKATLQSLSQMSTSVQHIRPRHGLSHYIHQFSSHHYYLELLNHLDSTSSRLEYFEKVDMGNHSVYLCGDCAGNPDLRSKILNSNNNK